MSTVLFIEDGRYLIDLIICHIENKKVSVYSIFVWCQLLCLELDSINTSTVRTYTQYYNMVHMTQ